VSNTFSKSTIPSLSDGMWQNVQSYLSGSLAGWLDERGLAVIDFDSPTALALMFALASDGHAWLSMRVYHDCCEDEHVTTRAYQDGFQPTPWLCPACNSVASSEQLTYRLQCVLLHDVELVP
jgi:hypothetical protein